MMIGTAMAVSINQGSLMVGVLIIGALPFWHNAYRGPRSLNSHMIQKVKIVHN